MGYNYSNVSPASTFSLDLETRESADANDYHTKCGHYNVSAKKNLVDPEKIKKDKEDKLAKINDGNALDWKSGAICSVALVNVGSLEVFSSTHTDEKAVLIRLLEYLATQPVYFIIGENLRNFDMPFLIGRLMVHGLKIPDVFFNSYNYGDIGDLFKFNSMGSQSGTLNEKCIALGMDAKLMKGSHVPELCIEALMAQATGDMEKFKEIMLSIKDYNIDDAMKVALILRKFLGLDIKAEATDA